MMKKKTIKFCFFSFFRVPSIQYFFFTTKRCYFRNKLLIKWENKIDKLHNYRAKSIKKYKYILIKYKLRTNYIAYLNQFFINFGKTAVFFKNSYYNKKRINMKNKLRKRKYIKFKKIFKKLRYFYKIKRIVLRRMYKKYYKFINRKILSSHFVFAFTNKSRMYYGMYKYKPKTQKTLHLFNYIYMYTILMKFFMSNIQSRLYFFSLNSSCKSFLVTEEFNLIATNWNLLSSYNFKKNLLNSVSIKNIYTQMLYSPTKYSINQYDFKLTDILLLLTNYSFYYTLKTEILKNKEISSDFLNAKQLLKLVEISHILISYNSSLILFSDTNSPFIFIFKFYLYFVYYIYTKS